MSSFGGSGRDWKRLQNDFAAVEREVAAFADAGRQQWREGNLLLAPLLRLESVQAGLSRVDAADADAQRDAVEAAIEAAIERLPEPKRRTAKAHFGFPGPDPAEDPSISARRKLAAELFGAPPRVPRWYQTPNPGKCFGLTPERYIVTLVTASLMGAQEPIAVVAEAVNGVEPPAADLPAAEDLEPDGPAGALLVVALVLVLALFVNLVDLGKLTDWRGGGGDPIPPRGSIVDARTGEAFAPQLVRPRADSRGLAWEHVFWACDRSAEDCDSPQLAYRGTPMEASPGDTIDFRIRLYDPRGEPVSVLRLAATPNPALEGASVRLSIEWPVKGRSEREGLGLETHRAAVSLRLPPQASLVYDEGSTMLYGAAGEEVVVARLPEGIMDPPGIKLRNVGAPGDCWNCSLEFVRYVGFEATVE